MSRSPLPPLAAVVSYIDCINRGDLDGLLTLMAPDHVLQVLAEAPVMGTEMLRTAWQGYFAAYPNYVIYPRLLVEHDGFVAVLGSTTSSHLGLPDAEERLIDVIWTAEVANGRLVSWSIVEATPATRQRLGLS
jgi:hypothetical protein